MNTWNNLDNLDKLFVVWAFSFQISLIVHFALIKKPTFQHLSREGLQGLKDTVIMLADAVGLPLHARAVAERFRFA